MALNTRESFWKGDVSNTNGSSKGIVNLYMGNGATWTGNNLSGNTVNANLDNATWTGYSNGNAMHLKLDNSIWNVNGASKLASFSGNKGSIFVASDAGDISVADYSGNTTVIYNHDADNPTNILGGSFTIGQANTGSNITLITDNQGITKGFKTPMIRLKTRILLMKFLTSWHRSSSTPLMTASWQALSRLLPA